MRATVGTGAIFIKDGALLPEALRLESESYVDGWRLVKSLDGYSLDRKTSEAGWTFFCLAGEINASCFGFEKENTERRAINRLLANARSGKFNCLEIVRADSGRFLGVPHATVYAHSRHIQKSIFLFRDERSESLEKTNSLSDMKASTGRTKGKPQRLQPAA
ncbi:MAG: hypothetical protein WA737_09200 [Candidatus Acidiferrales bacterium]